MKPLLQKATGGTAMELNFGDKVLGTVHIRKNWRLPVKPNALLLDGQTLEFEVVGIQHDDEMYPGEYMLWVPSALGKSVRIAWIASGDVDIHENKGR